MHSRDSINWKRKGPKIENYAKIVNLSNRVTSSLCNRSAHSVPNYYSHFRVLMYDNKEFLLHLPALHSLHHQHLLDVYHSMYLTWKAPEDAYMHYHLNTLKELWNKSSPVPTRSSFQSSLCSHRPKHSSGVGH